MVTTDAPSPLAGLRILVVDDTDELAEILTFVLERAGSTVTRAADGLTAVERALAEDFDVIVMDVGLPGIDGLEACRRITSEREATVVMLSAREAAADRTAGTEAGAVGYLAKPFTPRKLVADLSALLEEHRRGAGGG